MQANTTLPLQPANLVFGEGNIDCKVLFIGEAPGFNEDKLKRPFVGRGGQLLDDVIDLSPDPDETGKVPGTDLRAGVPTMPYLLLGRASDPASRALKATIDDGVARIADGADPGILDEAMTHLRDDPATAETRRQAYEWADAAVAALDPIPSGVVRDALVKLSHVIVDRSS